MTLKLTALVAVFTLLSGCSSSATPPVANGGTNGSGTDGTGNGGGTTPTTIQGVATPSSVAVVTATNTN